MIREVFNPLSVEGVAVVNLPVRETKGPFPTTVDTFTVDLETLLEQ